MFFAKGPPNFRGPFFALFSGKRLLKISRFSWNRRGIFPIRIWF